MMRYLVRGEFVDTGALISNEQFVELVEKSVIPTFETFAKMENDKKILSGGMVVGARAAVFIVESSSNEELSEMLGSLPLWSYVRWEVTPLDTFSNRIKQDTRLLNQSKGKK